MAGRRWSRTSSWCTCGSCWTISTGGTFTHWNVSQRTRRLPKNGSHCRKTTSAAIGRLVASSLHLLLSRRAVSAYTSCLCRRHRKRGDFSPIEITKRPLSLHCAMVFALVRPSLQKGRTVFIVPVPSARVAQAIPVGQKFSLQARSSGSAAM
jgi:hypothetical protein